MAGIWASLRDTIRARLKGTEQAETRLTGAASARRQKTHSADSGYVYLYCFDGFRETPRAWEYVFTVSGDRKEWFAVAVVVQRDMLSAWSQDTGRELGASERFAVAKIALRRAFDVRETPADMRTAVSVDIAEMRAIAEILDLL